MGERVVSGGTDKVFCTRISEMGFLGHRRRVMRSAKPTVEAPSRDPDIT